jgi:hypothetical protein
LPILKKGIDAFFQAFFAFKLFVETLENSTFYPLTKI